MERYLAAPAALLALGLPLAALALPRRLERLAVPLAVALLGIQVEAASDKLLHRRFAPPPGTEAAAGLLETALRSYPDHRVEIDPRGHAAQYLLWRAGVPPSSWGRHFDWREDDAALLAHFSALVRWAPPTILVVVERGAAERALALAPGYCGDFIRENVGFRCLGRSGWFRVYRMAPIGR